MVLCIMTGNITNITPLYQGKRMSVGLHSVCCHSTEANIISHHATITSAEIRTQFIDPRELGEGWVNLINLSEFFTQGNYVTNGEATCRLEPVVSGLWTHECYDYAPYPLQTMSLARNGRDQRTVRNISVRLATHSQFVCHTVTKYSLHA